MSEQENEEVDVGDFNQYSEGEDIDKNQKNSETTFGENIQVVQ